MFDVASSGKNIESHNDELTECVLNKGQLWIQQQNHQETEERRNQGKQ